MKTQTARSALSAPSCKKDWPRPARHLPSALRRLLAAFFLLPFSFPMAADRCTVTPSGAHYPLRSRFGFRRRGLDYPKNQPT